MADRKELVEKYIEPAAKAMFDESEQRIEEIRSGLKIERHVIKKDESGLKRKLIARIPTPEFLVFAHSDLRKYGIPDLSISGHGRTTWWELKHATPRFATKEIQEITCLRLAHTSFCRYVIYVERGGRKQTLIVHPKEVFGKNGNVLGMPYEQCFEGFDHDQVTAYIKLIHLGDTQ